jgi:hypothetical protein
MSPDGLRTTIGILRQYGYSRPDRAYKKCRFFIEEQVNLYITGEQTNPRSSRQLVDVEHYS